MPMEANGFELNSRKPRRHHGFGTMTAFLASSVVERAFIGVISKSHSFLISSQDDLSVVPL